MIYKTCELQPKIDFFNLVMFVFSGEILLNKGYSFGEKKLYVNYDLFKKQGASHSGS